MTDKPKGQFTFRFAAVCFGLSAVGELFSLGDSVPLLGVIVGGVGAAAYHALYTALFAWLALGLWTGRHSGYYVLLATTMVYTVDRLQLLFVGNALETLVRQQLAGMEQELSEALNRLGQNGQGLPPVKDILALVNVSEIVQTLTVAVFAFLLCWWGFVAWAYYRRSYFGIR